MRHLPLVNRIRRLFDPTWRIAREHDAPPRCIHVLPKHRIVWVKVAKSGCTSIIQLLSQLHGSSRLLPYQSALPEWSEDGTWHDAQVHGVPRLLGVTPSVRHEAIHAAGWWRFAVVRDPYARFLSAWVDKVFLRSSVNVQLFEGAEDVLLEDGRIDMTATLDRFVQVMSRWPSRYLNDHHFAPQHSVLCRNLLPSLEVLPFSRISEVCSRIEKLTGKACMLRRLNSSLSLVPDALYRDESLHLVSTLYRADLGCDPAVPAAPKPLTSRVILDHTESQLVRRFRAATDRIRELSALATPTTQHVAKLG